MRSVREIEADFLKIKDGNGPTFPSLQVELLMIRENNIHPFQSELLAKSGTHGTCANDANGCNWLHRFSH